MFKEGRLEEKRQKTRESITVIYRENNLTLQE